MAQTSNISPLCCFILSKSSVSRVEKFLEKTCHYPEIDQFLLFRINWKVAQVQKLTRIISTQPRDAFPQPFEKSRDWHRRACKRRQLRRRIKKTQRRFSPLRGEKRSSLKTFHEFTGIQSDLKEMQKVHKTTRFPPDRDTFIAYTFSAAEGIAAANDSPRLAPPHLDWKSEKERPARNERTQGRERVKGRRRRNTSEAEG